MTQSHPPTVRQAFDPLLLDVLEWSPLDEECRDPALRDSLKAAVDELPALQREVINAMFWEQVPRRKLARRLGISRATVNTAYEKALEALHAVLHPSD